MGMKNGRLWSSKTLKYLKRKKRLPKWAMKNFLESNYKTEKKEKGTVTVLRNNVNSENTLWNCPSGNKRDSEIIG